MEADQDRLIERHHHIAAVAEDFRPHDQALLALLSSDALADQGYARHLLHQHVRAVREDAKTSGVNPAIQRTGSGRAASAWWIFGVFAPSPLPTCDGRQDGSRLAEARQRLTLGGQLNRLRAASAAVLVTVVAGCGSTIATIDTAPLDRTGCARRRPAGRGGAAALEVLPVKGRAPRTGYDRDQFGPAWKDISHNGCDQRNDAWPAT